MEKYFIIWKDLITNTEKLVKITYNIYDAFTALRKNRPANVEGIIQYKGRPLHREIAG